MLEARKVSRYTESKTGRYTIGSSEIDDFDAYFINTSRAVRKSAAN